MSVQLSLIDVEGSMTPEKTEHSSTAAREGQKRISSSHLKPAIGTNQCKCYQCGECFNSVSAFDCHQRLDNGRVICFHPLDIVDRHGNPKPMAMNVRGWWVIALREPGAFEGRHSLSEND